MHARTHRNRQTDTHTHSLLPLWVRGTRTRALVRAWPRALPPSTPCCSRGARTWRGQTQTNDMSPWSLASWRLDLSLLPLHCSSPRRQRPARQRAPRPSSIFASTTLACPPPSFFPPPNTDPHPHPHNHSHTHTHTLVVFGVPLPIARIGALLQLAAVHCFSFEPITDGQALC